ncbi:Transposon Ty3-I Gag-Pol polyprotein [Gossypium australe]|uniref:Transposon Ty3-I Gag-Pol polyprotein n=1 Tax=Gossypium australe TaxID=47621 RepID=A0A5B6W176_9ROSI|nr:Transposon Ty3-I Gag-Pol polyprotein [Gossypium australe]
MSVQLADRTIRYPRGVIEDVLVKIDKFMFFVDFVVLDMDEGSEKKPKNHDEEPKQRYDEHVMRTNQFKVGDKILLEKADPRISPSKLESNGSTLCTVLNVFPYDTVEVTNSELETFKVNNTRLKPYFDNNIVDEKEELQLRKPP